MSRGEFGRKCVIVSRRVYADFPTQTRTLAQWLASEELEGQQASVLCLMRWSYTELRKT